ncbi:hypothetical protein VTK73DRAFT_1293 [Phialemonium thermophilum]|uniref:Uncharacterized protein n=1 Tax=Phialemonium thermophilum TaxID=223376 RepID=A0ABR3VTR0_9PEZI
MPLFAQWFPPTLPSPLTDGNAIQPQVPGRSTHHGNKLGFFLASGLWRSWLYVWMYIRMYFLIDVLIYQAWQAWASNLGISAVFYRVHLGGQITAGKPGTERGETEKAMGFLADVLPLKTKGKTDVIAPHQTHMPTGHLSPSFCRTSQPLAS